MPAPTTGVNLFVEDVAKNLEYFTSTLGFREVERYSTPDGQIVHASVAWGKDPSHVIGLASTPIMTMPGPDGTSYDFGAFGEHLKNSPQTRGNGVVLSFRVPNVDKVHAKMVANGAMIDEPPTDQFWGERTISVLTPDNYYLTFAQPIKGWKAPAEMIITRAKLSTKQKAQRKYAGKMRGVRTRAAKAKGGKGRIAARGAAKKLRKQLGLGDGA